MYLCQLVDTPLFQVRKLAAEVTDKLSTLQTGFKRTLTADAKAFIGDAIMFRWVAMHYWVKIQVA